MFSLFKKKRIEVIVNLKVSKAKSNNLCVIMLKGKSDYFYDDETKTHSATFDFWNDNSQLYNFLKNCRAKKQIIFNNEEVSHGTMRNLVYYSTLDFEERETKARYFDSESEQFWRLTKILK